MKVAELSDQVVTLSPEAPEWSKRFEVETAYAGFVVVLELFNLNRATPELEVRPIDESQGSFKVYSRNRLGGYQDPFSDDPIREEYSIGVDCSKAFACVTQFEVVVKGHNVTTSPMEGTLTVSVIDCDKDYNCYAAIRPL